MRYLRLLPISCLLVSFFGCANTVGKVKLGSQPPAASTAETKVSLDEATLYEALTATLAMSREMYEVATVHYIRYIRATRDAEYAQYIAFLMADAGEYTHAETLAKLLLELPGDEQRARQRVLMFALKAKDLDTVIDQLNWALNAEGVNNKDAAISVLYDMLQRGHDKPFSMEVLQRLQRLYSKDVSGLRLVAALLWQYGKKDRAWDVLEQAVQLNPLTPKTVLLKAQFYVKRGQSKQAIQYLQSALQGIPNTYSIHYYLARLLLEKSRYEDARKEYLWLSSVGSEEKKAHALYTLALLMMDLQQRGQARIYFNQLIDKKRYVGESYYYLGVADQMDDLYQSAITHFRKVAKGSQYWLDAQYQSGRLIAETDGVDEALAFLRELDVQKPAEKKLIWKLQASILRKAGRREDAGEVYKKALLTYPEDVGLLYSQAILLSEMSAVAEAEAVFLKIIQRQPNYAHALNALGYILADKTLRHEEALGYIQRALELLPNDFAIMDSMGWVQYRLGHYDEAIKYLLKAYDGRPDPEIASHLGEVFWVNGDMGQAREVWSKALLNFPQNHALIEVIERYDY